MNHIKWYDWIESSASVHSTLGFLIFFFQKSKAVTIFWTSQFIVHWPIHLYQPGYVGCKAVSRKYQSESTGNEIAFKNQWGCQAIFCFFVFFIPGLISRQKYLEKTFVALLVLRDNLGGCTKKRHKTGSVNSTNGQHSSITKCLSISISNFFFLGAIKTKRRQKLQRKHRQKLRERRVLEAFNC